MGSLHVRRPIDLVLADNAAGMELVARHLVEIGVATVAYIGGAAGTEPGRVRNSAFERCWAQEAGAETAALFSGDFSFESGRSAGGEAILRLAQVPDTVVAANDLMVLGALQTLQRGGIEFRTTSLLSATTITWIASAPHVAVDPDD